MDAWAELNERRADAMADALCFVRIALCPGERMVPPNFDVHVLNALLELIVLQMVHTHGSREAALQHVESLIAQRLIGLAGVGGE